MMPRLFEYIDEYIVDECSGVGSEFRRADVKRWADDKGYEFDVGRALEAHRQTPSRKLDNGAEVGRVTTTERVGMGPKAHYRVVATQRNVSPAAVLRMHQQQAIEMVRRWRVEYECRMAPIGARHKRAAVSLKMAEKEVKLVAEVLQARFAWGDEDEGAEGSSDA